MKLKVVGDGKHFKVMTENGDEIESVSNITFECPAGRHHVTHMSFLDIAYNVKHNKYWKPKKVKKLKKKK